MSRRSGPRAGGFTLVELITVMILLAIISLAAVPALTSVGDTRRAAGAERLVQDLRFVRQLASARGQRFWVVFDTGAGSYTVHIEDDASPGRANRLPYVDPVTGRPFSVTLDSSQFGDVRIESLNLGGGSEIGFDYVGRPLASDETPLQSDGQITLSGSRIIHIESDTGFVQIVR